MELRLRTVVFQRNAEIENVPVLICDSCTHSEVFPPVKACLVNLLARLKAEPADRILVRFDECNEIARLIRLQQKQRISMEGVRRLIEERVNELLDTLLLAGSLGDEVWTAEIQDKLTELTDKTLPVAISS